MIIYTARMGYKGDDRLDITSRTRDLLGRPLAPPWQLVRPLLALRKEGLLTDAVWAAYERDYRQHLRRSYRANRAAWQALAQIPEVTLMCFCSDAERCHRRIAAAALAQFTKGQYLGERVNPQGTLFARGVH